MMRGDANFLVVIAWMTGRLDDREAELARKAGAGEIGVSHAMRVIPARAGGFGREAVASMAVGRDRRRSLVHGPVHRRRDQLPMPVYGLRNVGFIEDIDGNRLAFRESQNRARRPPGVSH